MIIKRTTENNNIFPKVISPEEKDKIVDALVNVPKNDFAFGYKDVPNLLISKWQFEEVIEELVSMGLIENKGYWDGGKKHKTSKLDTFYRFGGFKGKEEMLMQEFEKLRLEIKNLHETAHPSIKNKLEKMISSASNIANILSSIIG